MDTLTNKIYILYLGKIELTSEIYCTPAPMLGCVHAEHEPCARDPRSNDLMMR